MNSNGMKTLCLFILLAWVAVSATTPTPWATYDLKRIDIQPTNTVTTTTLIASASTSDTFIQLYKRILVTTNTAPALATTSYRYDRISYQPSQYSNTIDSTTYSSASTVNLKIIGYSQSLECVIFYDDVSTTKTAKVIKINGEVLKEQIIGTKIITQTFAATAVTNPKLITVSNDCTKLLINDVIYKFGTSSFVKDTTSLGSQTQLSCIDDLSYCVAGSDKNLYFFNTTTSKYEVTTNIPSLKSKVKMILKKYVYTIPLTQIDSLIIYSWQAQVSNTKVHDYIINVVSINTTSNIQDPISKKTYTAYKYTEMTKQFFLGTFYDATTPSINGPTVIISPSFTNIIAYGKDSASSYYSFGGYMNYSAGNMSEIIIKQGAVARAPSPIIGSFSSDVSISLSDNYVYLRNSSTQQAWYLTKNYLVPYLKLGALKPQETSNWNKTILSNANSGQLLTFREHIDLTTTFKINFQRNILLPTNQILRFDAKSSETDTQFISSSLSAAKYKPAWISKGSTTGSTNHFNVSYLNSSNLQITTFPIANSAQANKNVVAQSQSLTCILVLAADFTKVTTHVVSNLNTTKDLTPSTKFTGSQTFTVSDDCLAIRVGNAIYHWDGSSYIQDAVVNIKFTTTPVTDAKTNAITNVTTSEIQDISTLSSPIFSADFSVMIDNSKIYYYTSKTATDKAKYTSTSDKQYDYNNIARQIVKNGIRLIITGSSIIQFRQIATLTTATDKGSITTPTSTQFRQYKSSYASVSYSQKLTNIALYGNVATLLNIDWGVQKSVTEIPLPSILISSSNELKVSQDYLYARISDMHYAYAILPCSPQLLPVFNQSIPINPNTYKQTFILPDPSNTGKLILAYQYENSPFFTQWVRLIKDERSKPSNTPLSQTPLIYDPTTYSATSINLITRSNQKLRWIYERKFSDTAYLYESARLDTSQVGSYFSYVPLTVKAYSKDLSCAVLLDLTSSTKKVRVYSFQTNDIQLEEIIASKLVTEANANLNTYEVADSCSALRINSTIYHYNSSIVDGSKFIVDVIPTTALNIALTNNFNSFAADDGIYVYNATAKSYSKVKTSTFNQAKKIFVADNAVVVLTWTAEVNLKTYLLQAFSISQNYAEMTRIQGSFYDNSTTTNNGPSIAVSPSLKRVIVYGSASATTYFAKGKFISYNTIESLNVQNSMVFPSWATSAASTTFSVSDSYVYIRNNNTHGGFFSIGGQLNTYLSNTAINANQNLNLQRVLLFTSSSGEMATLKETNSANVITITPQTYNPVNQISRFDTTLTNTLTCVNTFAAQYKPIWIASGALYNSPSTGKFSVDFLNSTNLETTVEKVLAQDNLVKSQSQNMKCVLTYNKADGTLTTVSMEPDKAMKIIPSSLLTNIILSSANYSVSDDCLGFRVNDRIFHWNATTYALNNIAHPTTNITTIPNPVFSADFNVMVTDYGVYYYSSTTTTYSSDKTENFGPSKSVFKNGNNLIIVTRTDRIPYYNYYNITVQLRIMSGASSTLFKQMKFIFTTYQTPNVSVSDKLTNFILYGLSSDGISRSVIAKSIDWVYQTVNDINLPQVTKTSVNQFVVSQDYLYVRNSVGSLKKHYAYSISCSGLIEQFNEIIPIQAPDYVRTFILTDTSNASKLVLAHQFNGNNNWRRIVQDTRSKVYIPSYGEVRFTYDPTAGSATPTLIAKSSESFQWFYQRKFSDSSYTYESVKYDTTSKNNIKVVSFSSQINLTVKAYSKDLTCAALYDATSATKKLYIVRFVYNDNYTEQIIRSGLITVADAGSASIEVSSNCLALKINLLVYHYDPTTTNPSKYVNDNVPTSFVSPVFSADFKHVATNDGIYAYNASNRTYAKVRTAVFNASKIILTTQSGIIVLSWVAIATDSAIKSYSLQAFSISQNYNSMSNISGIFFDETTSNSPYFAVSQSLRRVIVYGTSTYAVNYAKGQYTPTYYYAIGKFISYNSYEKQNNLNDMVLPSWLTSTANTAITVSDNYIYARKNDSHIAYFSTGNQLYNYFNAVPLTTSETTNYNSRHMVQNVDSNELSVLRQHTSNNVLTLKRQIYTADSQILRFETTYNSTLSCVSTFDSYYKPGWISQGALNATANNKIYGAILNDTNYEKIIQSKIALNQYTWIVATSQNVKCMVIFDKSSQTVSTISVSDYTIKTVVLTGLTLSLSTANYSVSDDCLALRINDKIFHYSGSAYTADTVTHPTGVTAITNPQFSADFSVMVTDNAVYYYTSGKYTSDKAEKFDPIKYVLRNGSNLIIINYGKPVNFYNVNVQFRNMSTAGVNSSSVFSQFYVQFNDTQVPRYTVSQILTNFILYGLGAEGTSRISIAKSVDWPNNWVSDIILPQPAIKSKNEFVVSENYLYIRNLDGLNKKHYAYSVYCTTIVEQFNQTIPIQQSDYKRTFILADPTGAGNLVLAHAFNGNGNWIRLIKDTRSRVYASDNANTDAQYYRKVAIIVGVVIPISLLIIFAVVALVSKSSGSLFKFEPKVQNDKDIDRKSVDSQQRIQSNQYRP